MIHEGMILLPLEVEHVNGYAYTEDDFMDVHSMVPLLSGENSDVPYTEDRVDMIEGSAYNFRFEGGYVLFDLETEVDLTDMFIKGAYLADVSEDEAGVEIRENLEMVHVYYSYDNPWNLERNQV